MRATVATLSCTLLASVALATPAAPAPGAPDELQAARAKTCAAFLSEVSAHTAAGNPPGTTPSFAVIWAALLESEKANGGNLGKLGLGRLMFENTEMSCQRIRARTLGATMDAEFAKL
jgi:hypothetical protein